MAISMKNRWQHLRAAFAPEPTVRAVTVLKVNPVGEIMARLTGGQARPLYTPSQFRALAHEGFSANAYGYRAVMLIAQACAGIPWVLYQNGRSRRSELTSHPLLDLWRRPNPQQGSSGFVEALVAFWYITGNSYATVGVPETGPNKGVPKQLWTLRPDKVQIVPDPLNFIGGYIYTDYGARKELDASQVMQLKFFNPEHDFYGLSPLASAGRMIDAMNAGADYNLALMHNYAQPAGALIVKHSLEVKQKAKLEQLLRERYQGPSNAGMPMVLEGDEMVWQSFGMSNKDLEFLAGRVASIREIGIAVGVPPEMLGDVQGKTYANYSEARASFYEETVLPRMDNIRDMLNGWLVPMFGDNLYLDYNRDEIEALAEDRDKVWARAVQGWQAGLLSKNESRMLIGYDPLPDGDYYILAANYAIATPDMNPGTPNVGPGSLPQLPGGTIADDDAADLTGDDDSEEDGRPGTQPVDDNSPDAKLLTLLRRWQKQGYALRIAPVEHKAINLKTKEEKAAHWLKVEESRQTWYSEVAKQVEQQFQSEQKVLLAALKASATPVDGQQAVLAAIPDFYQDWMKLLAVIYASVGNAFGQQTYQAFQDAGLLGGTKAFPLDTWKQAVLDWLNKFAGTKITNILDTTRQQIQTQLAAGVDAGESLAQLAKRIEALFSGPNAKQRADLVSQTEVIAASNVGSRAAAKATGLQLTHEWIATPDSHTRETHAEANGQIQPMDTPYTVGGSQLMFPGDGSLGADISELARCRCVEGFHTAEEDF